MYKPSILMFLLLASGTFSQAASQSPAFPDPPVIRPGDMLDIIVWSEPELTAKVQVTSDGTLMHPLYRRLKVGGVPYSQLDSVVGQYLTGFREDPQFSVQPLLPVVVTGEVLEGGLLELGPGITIAQAITLAGLNDDARFDRVRLIRNRTLYTVDFADPTMQWSQETVRSGDQIIVLRQPDFMRDVVGPVTTIVGSVSSLVTFILFMSGQFK